MRGGTGGEPEEFHAGCFRVPVGLFLGAALSIASSVAFLPIWMRYLPDDRGDSVSRAVFGAMMSFVTFGTLAGFSLISLRIRSRVTAHVAHIGFSFVSLGAAAIWGFTAQTWVPAAATFLWLAVPLSLFVFIGRRLGRPS